VKILLVGNYPPAGQKSMNAFRRVLERELSAAGHEVRSVYPKRRVQRVAESSRWWKWLGYVDMFVLFLPRLLWVQRDFDVVHICDHGNSMYVPFVWRRPALVTCHDVIAIAAARGQVEGWAINRTGRIYQRLITAGLRRADLIACVSEHTRGELLSMQIAEVARTTTAHNGLNGDFSPFPEDRAEVLLSEIGITSTDRYLLHVGSGHPRKNRKFVLELFLTATERAEAVRPTAMVPTLVFVGPPLRMDMPDDLLARASGKDIRVIDHISHDLLRALYTRATTLVFPSTLEGFGWPIIEAQAAGCPVVTTNRPPMTEVGGDAAVYIDPSNLEDAATILLAALADRSSLSERGIDNAGRFSTQRMVDDYCEVYRKLLGAA
jgi:glycosyltransferase involved in cell wall biosynthesis